MGIVSENTRQELLAGSLHDSKTFLSGTYQGFMVALYPVQNNVWQIEIGAHSAADPGNRNLFQFVNGIKERNQKKQIYSVSVSDNLLCLQVAVAPVNPKKAVMFNELMNPVFYFLTNQGYRTCCSRCGNESETVAFYELNRRPVAYCDRCAFEVQNSFEQNKTDVQNRKSNVWLGVLGALLGSLIGGVIYVLVDMLGFWSGLVGYATIALAFFFYAKFGGYVDKKGIVICVITALACTVFAVNVSWAISAYKALKDYGWTFSECFRELSYIIEQSDLNSDYVLSILGALAFFFLGSVGTIINAVKNASGNYSFKKVN